MVELDTRFGDHADPPVQDIMAQELIRVQVCTCISSRDVTLYCPVNLMVFEASYLCVVVYHFYVNIICAILFAFELCIILFVVLNSLCIMVRGHQRCRKPNGLIGRASVSNDDGMAACGFYEIFMT